MKKLLLYSLAVFLFVSSCSKERSSQSKPPVNTGKKYAVKFNVDGFTQTINTINKKTLDAVTPGGLADNAAVLYYYAQNSAGAYVSVIKQTSAMAGFGTITDSLAAGTYTIALIAGGGPQPTQPGSPPGLEIASIGAMGPGFLHMYCTYALNHGQFRPWQDTFDKVFTITVGSQGVTQSVSLNRIDGEIEVNIQDAIPANLKTVQLSFKYEDSGYRIDADSSFNTLDNPYTYVKPVTIPDTAVGKTNYKINTIICNTRAPMTVTITCLDASNNTLSVTTVPNVRCQKNIKTVLSGNLFAGASVFQVSFDPTWDPTPINISF